MDNESQTKLVLAAIDQHHQYARHSIQLGFTWFAFSATTNLVGGGWFVAKFLGANKVPVNLLLVVFGGFLLCNTLGAVGLKRGAKALKWHHDSILGLLQGQSDLAVASGLNALPIVLYKKLLSLFFWAVLGITACWIAGVFVAFCER